jgi:hypothetical protein
LRLASGRLKNLQAKKTPRTPDAMQISLPAAINRQKSSRALRTIKNVLMKKLRFLHVFFTFTC